MYLIGRFPHNLNEHRAGRRRTALFLFSIMLLLQPALHLTPSTHAQVGCTQTTTWSGPIVFASDTELALAAHGSPLHPPVKGSGTQQDPYVLECIQAGTNHQDIALHVADVRSFIQIRDIDTPAGAIIYLEEVAHLTLASLDLEETTIRFESVDDVLAQDITIVEPHTESAYCLLSRQSNFTIVGWDLRHCDLKFIHSNGTMNEVVHEEEQLEIRGTQTLGPWDFIDSHVTIKESRLVVHERPPNVLPHAIALLGNTSVDFLDGSSYEGAVGFFVDERSRLLVQDAELRASHETMLLDGNATIIDSTLRTSQGSLIETRDHANLTIRGSQMRAWTCVEGVFGRLEVRDSVCEASNAGLWLRDAPETAVVENNDFLVFKETHHPLLHEPVHWRYEGEERIVLGVNHFGGHSTWGPVLGPRLEGNIEAQHASEPFTAAGLAADAPPWPLFIVLGLAAIVIVAGALWLRRRRASRDGSDP